MPRRASRRWLWFFGVLAILAVIAVTLETWYNLGQQLTPAQLEDARRRWQEHGPRDYDLVYVVTQLHGEPDVLEARLRHGEVESVTANGQPLEPVLYPFHDLPGLFTVMVRATGPAVASQTLTHTSKETGPQGFAVEVRQGKVVRVTWRRLPDPLFGPPDVDALSAFIGDGTPLPAWLQGRYDMEALFAAIARRLELDAAPDAPRLFAVGSFDKQDGHLLRYVRSVRRPRERIEISLIALTRKTGAAARP
jgi:hypothetical protein